MQWNPTFLTRQPTLSMKKFKCSNLKTAIRWEMQAEEDYGFYSHDIGYYLFNNGISELDAHEIKQKIAA